MLPPRDVTFYTYTAMIRVQRVCYSIPVMLTTPLMFGLMIGGCELWNYQPCSFVTSDLTGYLFYKCYERDAIGDIWLKQMWFMLPVWWLSQLWIAWHIWFPKNERLAKSEK